MRRLQHLVVRRQRQIFLEELLRLGLVLVEAPLENGDRRLLVVVLRPLALVLAVHVPPGHARRPLEVEHRLLVLQEEAEALEPVGHLGRDHLEVDPAQLLEVRELGDLHRVAPDLPAEAPRAEGRLLPVVLDQADVVLREVDPERVERAEVLVEHVLGRRLQDHLVLEVVLEAERVLAVAAVRGPDDGLDVGGAPLRLGRVEDADERVRIGRARAELGVVRLHDHGAALAPVGVQRPDHVLEVHAAKTTDRARREHLGNGEGRARLARGGVQDEVREHAVRAARRGRERVHDLQGGDRAASGGGGGPAGADRVPRAAEERVHERLPRSRRAARGGRGRGRAPGDGRGRLGGGGRSGAVARRHGRAGEADPGQGALRPAEAVPGRGRRRHPPRRRGVTLRDKPRCQTPSQVRFAGRDARIQRYSSEDRPLRPWPSVRHSEVSRFD